MPSSANVSDRLTSDIYPADLGWTVNWDKPEERQEWYHNMSSVMQAGPCVRSNQLDYDEDVMYKVCLFSFRILAIAELFIQPENVLTFRSLSNICMIGLALTRRHAGHLH